jgi:hypothetical protein
MSSMVVTCHLEAQFQCKEQPKVIWSEIWTVQWSRVDRNVFLDEEFLHNKRCVARYIIVMQKPLSLPLVAPLLPNCIMQTLQNLHDELMVQQTIDAK